MPRLAGHAWTLRVALCLAFSPTCLQATHVSGKVRLASPVKKRDPSPVVLWLTPVSASPAPAPSTNGAFPAFRLLQKHKQFQPHLLVIPAGASVEFPNLDPFFHNVFSLFDGKRFDLGLYESGSSRSIRFDRPGISYIFCNIHPEMSAVVVVLETPYYGVANDAGDIAIQNVNPGRYKMEIWQEAALPDELKTLSREVNISGDTFSLGTIRVKVSARNILDHKNKYGRDYDEPAPPYSIYEHK